MPADVLIDSQSRLTASLDGHDGVADLVISEIHVSPAPDFYVVFCVSFRSRPDAQLSPSYFMQDIGVSQQLPPWGLPALSPIVHSFLEVTIIDGHTMQTLSDVPLIMPPGSNVSTGLLFSSQMAYPEKSLHNFAWHDHWADMTPAEQAEIKSDIEDMLSSSVDYTVRQSFNAQGS